MKLLMWSPIVLVLAGGIFYLGQRQDAAAEEYPLANFDTWSPSAVRVRTEVAGLPATGSKVGDIRARELKLENLITYRCRNHTPQLAVRVLFPTPDRIAVLCPARMEPWTMDDLAFAAWRETRADVGVSCGVDLYLTYIGMPPVKVGELRPDPANPNLARIRYRPPSADRPLVSLYKDGLTFLPPPTQAP